MYYRRGSTSENIQVQRLEYPTKAQIGMYTHVTQKGGELMTQVPGL